MVYAVQEIKTFDLFRSIIHFSVVVAIKANLNNRSFALLYDNRYMWLTIKLLIGPTHTYNTCSLKYNAR